MRVTGTFDPIGFILSVAGLAILSWTLGWEWHQAAWFVVAVILFKSHATYKGSAPKWLPRDDK